MTIAQQQRDLTNVKALIAAGRSKMDAVDRDLKLEARADRIAAIRMEVAKQIDAIIADMAKRKAAAKDGLDVWSQDAVRRRAKFDPENPQSDAAQRVAVFETLRRTPTGALVEHLKDAIRSGSLAHAEAIRLEFYCRDNRTKAGEGFDRIFASVNDPQAKAMETELSSIIGVAELAEVLVREFTQGQSDPLGRMTAARAASLEVV